MTKNNYLSKILKRFVNLNTFDLMNNLIQNEDLFRLCPPSLVGAYYLQPPDARATFLHNDLLCNDTCSVTGGSITYWGGGGGGTNGKDPKTILNIDAGNCKSSFCCLINHIVFMFLQSL